MSRVGFSMLRGWEEGYSIPSFGMFIDKAQQGLGYGKQLLDLTIDAARQLGCGRYASVCAWATIPLIRIYLSRGFKEIERTKLVIEGTRDEKIIMIKDLD